jgi:ABC-type lipoprotein release transport system permease subunit
MWQAILIGIITGVFGTTLGYVFAYEEALLHVKQNSKYSCVLTLESEMP